MDIQKHDFGTLYTGERVHLYELSNKKITLFLSTYGATWVALFLPDKNGKRDDILLGYPTLEGYTKNSPYFGVTVGRFANRIGKGAFVVDGKTYRLPINDGQNTLHGGYRGFDKQNWKARPFKTKDAVGVRFELYSPAGDEGFPGNLQAEVRYALTRDHRITCEYRAFVDAPCPVNLTNHAYFNLNGEGRGTILDHEVRLFASQVLEVDQNLLPTGRILSVTDAAHGAFDFTRPKPIGQDIQKIPGGYDHCYVVDGKEGTLRPVAEVYAPLSGRRMRVFSTQPGVQFYTGNFLRNEVGKKGSVYPQHGGLCLETQHFPDSPNRSEFPSALFGPNRPYREEAYFEFSWES
ncbi:MAG: galactose mutarotase [Treponemataceae bacterium]|nr:galactose mutarotase [Treponemataceae bacterium]